VDATLLGPIGNGFDLGKGEEDHGCLVQVDVGNLGSLFHVTLADLVLVKALEVSEGQIGRSHAEGVFVWKLLRMVSTLDLFTECYC
jgi:hypothetical protein